MTDETRILRTVGVPIVIAIILLVMLPKMCAKTLVVSKARQEEAKKAAGLHIESSQKPVTYPAGLDAERVRYLVEIDSRFSAPYTVHVPKVRDAVTTLGEDRIVPALQRLGYVEAGSDGALTLTRDGLLHIEGLVEDANSWTFPVATRQFAAVTSIEGDAASASAVFAWKWQPNAIGAELISAPKRHEAKADLGRGTSSWTLTGLTIDSDLQ
jgi:hypothetical protein